MSYTVTYLVYPSLVTSLSWLKTAKTIGKVNPWWNLIHLLIYYSFDMFGRFTPKIDAVRKRFPLKLIVAIGFLRVVFIPLYCLMALPTL